MAFTVSVFYARCLEIERGTPVKVLGDYTQVDTMRATLIYDERRGISFQLHPDEIPIVEPFQGKVPWPTPLRGQVVSSIQWGGTTSLEIFPDWTPLLDYNRMSTAQARAAVPAFWQLIDEKRKWESCLQEAEGKFWELRFQRPQLLDVSNAVLAMRRYTEVDAGFRLNYCTRYIWQSIEKQHLAARHLERLNVLEDLRRHFDALPRRENRDWLVNRTEEEASALFEYTVPILYSALDILAHVINQVFELEFSESTVGFIGVVTGKPNIDNKERNDRHLVARFPFEPLTQFLLRERQEWIREVEVWRHHIIHHGTVEGGFWVQLISDADSVLPKTEREGDAFSLLQEWTQRLRQMLEQVSILLEQQLDRKTESLIAGGAARNALATVKPDESQAYEVVKYFLDLWHRGLNDATENENRQRLSFLYSRLTPASRQQWPFREFSRFVSRHPLLEWDFADGFGWSNGSEHGECYSFCADMKFAEQTFRWRFLLVLVSQSNTRKLGIDLTNPLCYPPSFTPRVALVAAESNQSDSATGHRDLLYDLEIKSVCSEVLQHVEIFIFWADIGGAHAVVGALNAGEGQRCELSWKDAFVPVGKDLPILAPQLEEEAYVRVIYRLETEEGVWWAENLAIPRISQ